MVDSHCSDTKFGDLRASFETCRISPADLDLMAFSTKGVLRDRNEKVVGECEFLRYRRKRNSAFLEVEDILDTMDLFDQVASDWCSVLVEHDEWDLWEAFNRSCILIAHRVWIDSAYRGTSAWRYLMLTTLGQSVAELRDKPPTAFLKPFPLDFEGKVSDLNRKEFELEALKLRRLYAIHLGAKVLDIPNHFGTHMSMEVPQ